MLQIFRRNRIVGVTSIVLFVLLILFSCRNYILRGVVNTKIAAVEARYGIDVQYRTITWNGLRTIRIADFFVYDAHRDTLVSLSKAKVVLAFKELIRGKVNPLQVNADSLNVKLKGLSLATSEAAALSAETFSVDTTQHDIRFDTRNINRLLRLVIGISTSDINITNFSFQYADSATQFSLQAPSISSLDGKFSSTISYSENSMKGVVVATGQTSKHNRTISFSFYGANGEVVEIPFINRLLGAQANFSSLNISLDGTLLQSDSIMVSVGANVSNLLFYHALVSDRQVMLQSGDAHFDIALSSQKITIDSSSFIRMNSLTIPFYVDVDTRSSVKLKVAANTGFVKAADLFGSLPQGLFTTLEGIGVSGELRYMLQTDIDFLNPDSLKFFSSLEPRNFRLVHQGATDFTALSDTFTHSVYVNGSLVRQLHSPSFVPISSISSYLVSAVVASEDGGYWLHKGFDAEGFRYALAKNIKQKRFARGGSTISQQLVKNIYLNQKKNLMRKAEEALIVWLIENNQLVSKERMLQVYFNIIEWGPNVYGVREASQFYFDVEPKDLSLNQSLYLASIVPSPLSYRFRFDSLGVLRNDVASDFFHFVSNTLFTRGLINQQELDSVNTNVFLTGEALNYLKRVAVDSVSMDSTITFN